MISTKHIGAAILSVFGVQVLIAFFSIGSISLYVAPKMVEASPLEAASIVSESELIVLARATSTASEVLLATTPEIIIAEPMVTPEVIPAAVAAESVTEEAEVVAQTLPESEPEPKSIASASIEPTASSETSEVAVVEESATSEKASARTVPFYSQFDDISSPKWKPASCGIAGTAMLIEYYTKAAVSADTLLAEGIADGSFIPNVGWTHAGLIKIAQRRGLSGEAVQLAHLGKAGAFAALEKAVAEGPVMVSVYYTFTPGHHIPHLVVINDIVDGIVYYNDPAEEGGGGTISVEKFKPAWKDRYIAFRS